MSAPRGRWLLASATAVCAALALWRAVSPTVDDGDAASPRAERADVRPGTRTQPSPGSAPGMLSGAVATATPRMTVDQLLERGSLRGTEIDGDWGTWAGDTLQPSLSLRRRFDYLLTGIGEVDAVQLRAWVSSQVALQHGAAGAQQVLAVWDRYVSLLHMPAATPIDPNSDESFQHVLAALSTMRKSVLGPAWAHAFYAEDEAEAAAFIARRAARRAALAAGSGDGTPKATGDAAADPLALLTRPAVPLTAEQARQRDADRVARFGAEAAERLRAADAEWTAWEGRLTAARQRREAIDADPQLSPEQRTQAQEADLAREFSGTELMRARAMMRASGA